MDKTAQKIYNFVSAKTGVPAKDLSLHTHLYDDLNLENEEISQLLDGICRELQIKPPLNRRFLEIYEIVNFVKDELEEI